ncbi:hypothetical protein DFH06DRAFT_1341671 [Mycena polygramma]|nr:hypothetical protein DFH06DRAFT_1341671 [Mycena polygramma]
MSRSPNLSDHGEPPRASHISLQPSALTSHSDYYSAGLEYGSASQRQSPVPTAQPIRVHYARRDDGSEYLVEEATGLPVDIVGHSVPQSATSRSIELSPTHQENEDMSLASGNNENSQYAASTHSPPPRGGSPPNQTTRTPSPDKLITPFTELLSRIPAGALAQADMDQLHNLRGVITTSRDHLLSSTVHMAKQHDALGHTHDSIVALRNEAASRLASLHNEVMSDQSKVNRCLMDNITVLREMGASSTALTSLLATITNGDRTTDSMTALPRIAPLQNRAVVPPQDIQSEMDHVIPPQGVNETDQEFEQRVLGTIRRKSRAAAAFTIPTSLRPPMVRSQNGERGGPGRATETQGHYDAGPHAPIVDIGGISTGGPGRATETQGHYDAGPHAPIVDIGGISTAHRGRDVRFGALPATRMPSTSFAGLSRNVSGHTSNATTGDVPATTVFDEFTADMAKVIRRVIHRQLGKAITLPNHVRPPKVDPPGKYSGTDNHGMFIQFLERICTWLKSQLITGPETDSYRITLLAGQLEGYASEWLTELLEDTHDDVGYEPPFELTFANVFCEMHKRFVTSANAQQATVDFEKVKYDPATGPDRLMNELTKYGARMREKPSPFTI